MHGRQRNHRSRRNIEGGTEEYWGIGWYQTEVEVPEEWLSVCVRLYFHSAYHDAKIYVNGELAGEHKNSGYTPFTVNISEYIKEGKNIITVEADNRFSPDMLPVNRSFDWANDGGIIRPVELWVTGKQYIKELTITAKPVILEKEGSQIKITCRNNLPSYTVQGYSLLVLDKENKKEIRIPKLLPGMSWTTILEKGDVTVQILRPNGEVVVEK